MKSFQEYIKEVHALDNHDHRSPMVKDSMTTKPIGEKIGETESGHHIYRSSDVGRPTVGALHVVNYTAYNPQTKQVDMHINGYERKHKNGSSTINDIAISGRKGSTIKAHDLYHHLITKHNKILHTDMQSEGGRKTWVGLSKKKDVHIHGWHRDMNSKGGLGGHGTRVDPSKKLLHYSTGTIGAKNKYKFNTQLVAHKADPDPTD